jgi:hypothetical protein
MCVGELSECDVQGIRDGARRANLWNEPDNPIFWSGTIPELSKMCADAAAIIRKMDPSAIIVSPSPTGYKPDNWLSKYYAANGKPNQDVMSFHSASTISQTLLNLTNARAVMAANGDANKIFYLTEGNWGVPQNVSLDAEEKAAFLAQEYLLLWASGVRQYDWYASDNQTLGALQTTSGALTPAGVAYGQLFTWLVGSSHMASPCTKAADTTWTCTLRLPSGPAVILWNELGSKTVSAAGFTRYRKLDGPTSYAIGANSVLIGPKPILLTH